MPIYLDHAATTPLLPAALDAMLPYLTTEFGNPSGGHAVSRAAKQAIEDARDDMAARLGCAPAEVVFTSGGTEADNMAVSGVVGATGGSAVCSAVEHHAVLHPVEAAGGRVAPVTPDGLLDLDALRSVLDDDVSVVSVLLANNEVGIVQPLAEIDEVVRRHAPRAVLHSDAVQGVLWLDVAALTAPADMVSIAAHKFGGPKGVGALVVRRGTPLRPLMLGGGQELERRSGTHNVAGIVGMSAALRVVTDERDAIVERVRELRDRLLDGLRAAVPGVRETGRRDQKTAGNAHVRIDGIESEALLVLLDDAGVCASAGSACASGAIEPSHVLLAMGIPKEEALGSLRLSLGPSTTMEDVDGAVGIVETAVRRLRS